MKLQKIYYKTLEEVERYRTQHSVQKDILVWNLVRSFEERGWSGPPLVVRLDDVNDLSGDGVLDSGVHRLAALQILRERNTHLQIPVVYPRHLHLHISSSYDGRDWLNRWVVPYTWESRANLFATNAICLRAMNDHAHSLVHGVYASVRCAMDGAIAATMAYTDRYLSNAKDRTICLCGLFDEAGVRGRMKSWHVGDHDPIKYRPGRLRDVVLHLDVTRIVFLYMDTESYRQTMLVLQHLYPKVDTNGWVYVASWGRPGIAEAVESYFSGLPDADVWPGQRGPLFWQKDVPGGAFWTGEKDTLRLYRTEDELNRYILAAQEVVA